MRRISRNSGNVTILVVIFVAVLALGLGFFLVNFTQLFAAKKEAQTAIDAAALEAAKQVGGVAVRTPLGYVGVVDMAPNDPLHPGRRDNTIPLSQPIRGYNTLLGTVRLDMLIAAGLENQEMVRLARNDLTQLGLARAGLKASILARQDEIKQAAETAYKSNNQRANPQAASAAPNLSVELGSVTGGISGIPVPVSGDPVSAGNNINGSYKAGVNYPVAGQPDTFIFMPIASEPRLVDTPAFKEASADELPIAVRVTNQVQFQGVAPGDKGKPAGTIKNVACATAGGQVLTNLSTVYSIAFAGGLPPPAVFGGRLSAAGIMNTPQAFSGYSQSTTTWFGAPSKEELGGREPNGVPTDVPVARPFAGRTSDNPSVALAFGIYDWLRSNGLRPNPASVINALKEDLAAIAGTNGQREISLGPESAWSFLQAAYAQDADDDQELPASSCLMQSPMTEDLRQMILTSGSPESFQLLANAWSYEPAAAVCPAQAGASVFDSATGNSLTEDGQPIGLTCDFLRNLYGTDLSAVVSVFGGRNGLKILKVLKRQATADKADPTRAAASNAFLSRFPELRMRAKSARVNGHDTHNKVFPLIKNFKKITAMGLIKNSDGTFTFGNRSKKRFTPFPAADIARPFSPAEDPAPLNVEQVRTFAKLVVGLPVDYSLGLIASGDPQALRGAIDLIVANTNLSPLSSGNGSRSWKEPGNAITADVVKRADAGYGRGPALARAAGSRQSWFDLPASAAPPSSARAGEFIFVLRINGDAARDKGAGRVNILPLTSLATYPFQSNKVLPGQTIYMAADSLIVSGQDRSKTVWSVVARDQTSNLGEPAALSQQSPADWCKNGFGISLGGGDCPVESGEYRLGCPLPVVDGCCQVARKFTANLRATVSDDDVLAEPVNSDGEDQEDNTVPTDELDLDYCPPIPKQFF